VRRRRLVGAAVLLLMLALAMVPAVSLATLTSAPTTPATFTTTTLLPPTAVTGAGGTGAALAWTPSAPNVPTAATGYQLLRSATSGSGYAQVKVLTPLSTASTTDAPGNGAWYYVLRTIYQSWTSASSNEATVYIGPQVTGYKGCTGQAAVTSGSGDNNGFQTTPGYACAIDGQLASDPNSGTGNSTLCTASGKDRHRFYGYVFALPASVTSIDGITVQVRASTNNATGTYGMCVELSSDSGVSWTTPVQAIFGTSALTTYTFGGASNKWGRAWNINPPADLASGPFQVRITNTASNTTTTFNLDFVGVSVNFAP
jgi:hypothetical protein